MPKMRRIFSFVTFMLLLQVGESLFIDGCPAFGCRPSGSFSFYLDIPRNGMNVNWMSTFVLNTVPEALGCVANSINIVCQSNGPFKEDTGYVGVFGANGTIKWRDGILRFPALPLLDNYGNVTGSDGNNLVHYDANGHRYPVIPCQNLKPLFSMELVGSIWLLLLSQNGCIVVYQTNGVPVGSINLTATVNTTEGVFLPIAPPVVQGNRFYVLSEFVPDSNKMADSSLAGLRRLFAIDVHESISDRISIVWHMDFPSSFRPKYGSSTQRGSKTSKLAYVRASRLHLLKNPLPNKQAILWDEKRKMVIVNMSPSALSTNPADRYLVGIKEMGNTSVILYQTKLNVVHMTMFESDHCDQCPGGKLPTLHTILWVSLNDSKIVSINKDGSINQTFDLLALLKTNVTITSKISAIRNDDSDKDIIICGIQTGQPLSRLARRNLQHKLQGRKFPNNKATSFIVALDTSATENSSSPVLWMTPVPDNFTVKGQISGSSGMATGLKDQLVAYAESTGTQSKIFSLM